MDLPLDIPTPPVVPRATCDWDAVSAALDGIPTERDRILVKQKSRDFYWYSPILKRQLREVTGDMIVTPQSVEDVRRVAQVAHRFGAPVTVRGAGTGNYGQCMPLAGGIVLDLSGLNRILEHRPGWVRVEPGAKLIDMDDQLRPNGWEIRMHPSTKRTATIGGFVAGGSGGIGSIQWGGLREPGNIIAAKVMTMEAEPRIIELRGLEVQRINRAYGTNGIIIELEMPLAPAWPWMDVLIRYPDFEQCLRAAEALQLNDGIAKKLVTPIAWPIPRWFRAMAEHAAEGENWLIAMISEPDLEAAKQVIAPFGGTIAIETPLAEGPGVTPLYEYTWNHTTLQLLKTDKSITYLQSLFPEGQVISKTMELWARYGDEVIPHLEMIRFNGRPTASALQIVRFTTEERLWRIIAEHEEAGVRIANPHVFTLEDGSRHKRLDADRQLALKRDADPKGLMNPGKMRAFAD